MFLRHVTISPDDYRRRSAEEKRRNCSKHRDSAITLACLVCLQTLCTKCLSSSGQCKKGLSVCYLRTEAAVKSDKVQAAVCVTGQSHQWKAVESVTDEARRCLQLKQEEAKNHQTDVGGEMKKCKKSLRSLETDYNKLIKLIHKHRDQQVSGSCLLDVSVVAMSPGKLVSSSKSFEFFCTQKGESVGHCFYRHQ